MYLDGILRHREVPQEPLAPVSQPDIFLLGCFEGASADLAVDDLMVHDTALDRRDVRQAFVSGTEIAAEMPRCWEAYDFLPGQSSLRLPICSLKVLDDSPARHVGLRPRDAIIEVNGRKFDASSLDERMELWNRIGAKIPVRLKLRRGSKVLEVGRAPEKAP